MSNCRRATPSFRLGLLTSVTALVVAANMAVRAQNHSSPSVEQLRQNLKHPRDDVRKESAVALGKIGSKAAPAVEELIDLLIDEKFEHWPSVSDSLVKIRASAGAKAEAALPAATKEQKLRLYLLLDTLYSEDPIQLPRVLSKGLLEGDPGIRSMIASRIVTRHREKAIDALPAILKVMQLDDVKDKVIALGAIAALGPKAISTVPQVYRFIQNRNSPEALRSGATTCLAAIGSESERISEILRGILSDDSESDIVRIRAIVGLRESKFLQSSAVDLLKLYRVKISADLESDDALLFEFALIDTITKLKFDKKAIPTLKAGFRGIALREHVGKDSHYRFLVKATGEIGSDASELVPELLNAMNTASSVEMLMMEFPNALERVLGRKAALERVRTFDDVAVNTRNIEIVLERLKMR